MKYAKRLSAGYLAVCIAVFILSIYKNTDYFYRITIQNIWGYQLRQAGSVLLLFVIGYLFLKAIQQKFQDHWVALLAFPCGISLWVFVSFGLLSADIVYYGHRVYLLIGIGILLCFIIRRLKKVPVCGRLLPHAEVCCLVAGTAFLVSTGWNYVIMNYDSYLYFANFGKTLTILQEWKAFSNQNSYVLTNVGQFLPLLNSYAAFWGLDYCLPVQSFLMLNVVSIFALAVYDKVRKQLDTRKAAAYTGLFVLLFVSCTALLVYSNWLLSNAYLMVYLFLAFLIGSRAPDKIALDYAVVITGCALSVTLLRKDGIIIICFVFVCYACRRLWNNKWLVLLFLPSAIVQMYYIYFVKMVIYAQTHTAVGTSILNTKFILLTAAAIAATVVYLLFFHALLYRMVKEKICLLLLIGMGLAVMGAILLKPQTSIDHIDAIFRVLAGSSYGFSIIVWGILFCAVLIARPQLDYHLFAVFGYCMLTFLIYWNKGNTEQGIDNSGMRAFYQIIPMIYYTAAVKMAGLFGGSSGGHT